MKVVLDTYAFEPKKAHKLDAGFDLQSPHLVIINPNDLVMVDTGVHVEIPIGCVGFIKSRSSMFRKGIMTDGTIDCGYTGSICVMLRNLSAKPVVIDRGDKIAQLVVQPIHTTDITIVDHLEETERGNKGFGSAGL